MVFSHLGFWSGNLFLIAPFPDLCLLVPFCSIKDGQSTERMAVNNREFVDVKMNFDLLEVDVSHIERWNLGQTKQAVVTS